MPTAIIPNLILPDKTWGIIEEPRTSDYFAAYFEALGDTIQEGITLLDYGCGCGRFVNYLSAKLDNFFYYGIEQDNDFGRMSIAYGQSLFGRDPRVKFGLVGSAVEAESIDRSSIAVLSSVFTHLSFAMFDTVMLSFAPILSRGPVVFSCFIDDVSRLEYHGIYGPGTFGMAFYTWQQLQDYALEHNLSIVEKTRRFVDFDHIICRAEIIEEPA